MGRPSGLWRGAVVVVVDAALAAVTVMTCAAASERGAGSEAGDANGPQRQAAGPHWPGVQNALVRRCLAK